MTSSQYSRACGQDLDTDLVADVETASGSDCERRGQVRRAYSSPVVFFVVVSTVLVVVFVAQNNQRHSSRTLVRPSATLRLQEVSTGADNSATAGMPGPVARPYVNAELNDYFEMGMGLFSADGRMHDGNVCQAGEEFFGGLCYKTCESLTNGKAKNRTAAMTCCVDASGGCGEGEELFSGLCYKTCAALTGGTAPLRTSAMTCCNAADIKSCGVTNQKHDVGLCSGYSVEGDGQSCPHPPGKCITKAGFCKGFSVSLDGKSCPHTPGKCLEDEELYMNNCYKKCSILTNNTSPNRMGAFTCCSTSGLACLSPSNSDTTANFAVSGGAGDHDASTPGNVHAPIQTLTESSAQGSAGTAIYGS